MVSFNSRTTCCASQAYLVDRWRTFTDRVELLFGASLGECAVLGDSPLVLLTALRGTFRAEPSSSPSPRAADADRRRWCLRRPRRGASTRPCLHGDRHAAHVCRPGGQARRSRLNLGKVHNDRSARLRLRRRCGRAGLGGLCHTGPPWRKSSPDTRPARTGTRDSPTRRSPATARSSWTYMSRRDCVRHRAWSGSMAGRGCSAIGATRPGRGALIQKLIDAGFAVASIDYRHSREAPFPASA